MRALLSLIPVYWLLITSTHAASSPDSALDAYRRGNYRSAEAQYSQLAKQKAEDARLRFNAGAAAYKNNDLTNAATWFESASGAPDLELQQQAYYNLGNTRFRLGASAQDPQARMKEWEQSLQHYGSALKLNQADTNAASNLAFVQQALEQLKQQMPQQPQSGQDDKQKKDKQDDQKDPSDQPQSKDQQQSEDKKGQTPEQENKDPQSQDSKDDPSKDAQKSDSKDPGKEAQEKPAEPDHDKGTEQKEAGKEAGPGKDNQGAGNESFAEQQGKPGEMTPVQAERLLDQQKGEEKALIFKSAAAGKEPGQRQRKKLKQW